MNADTTTDAGTRLDNDTDTDVTRPDDDQRLLLTRYRSFFDRLLAV